MNGFTPDEMSRGGDAAAAVAAVVAAAAAAAASAGNGTGAGAGAEVPGAGTVSVAGPPGAAGPGPGQLCCLREDGERCGRAAGNASFSKRIQKSISQKKVKIELDKSVSNRGIALPSCPLVGSQESGKGTDCRRGLPDLAAVRSRGVCVWKQITKSLQLRPPPQHTHNTHAVVPLFFPTLPPASRCLRLSRALSSLFLLLCDQDTKQRGPPDRGPRVVFLQPGSSSGMEAPLFCCPSWCLAPGGANSPRLGESGGPSRSRKILFLSVFRLLRSGVRGKPSSPAAWQ